MRTVIVHYHLFKNAGSSLDFLLSEAFRKDWLAWDPGRADAVHDARDIMELLKDNQDVKAVSSHTLRLPKPVMTDVRIIAAAFVRHPILRAASVYKYDRGLERRTPRQRVASQSSFAEYIRWSLSAPGVPIICDFQTLYYSGDQLRYSDPTEARADRRSLLRALATLEGIDLLGVVERFRDSVGFFAYRLRRLFPTIAWREVRENTTAPYLTELDEIRNELGEELYQRLETANAFDLALYERAIELFQTNLELV